MDTAVRQHHHPLDDAAIDQLFRDARTQNKWQEKPVAETTIRAIMELVKMAPTSANCAPARFKILISEAAKEKLKPHLDRGNVDKTMTAPVVIIVGHDMEFYNELPRLFPHADARSWFVGNEELIRNTAFRNGTLQGAYLIMAARSLGLDVGAMSGFSNAGVDDAFFSGTPVKSNFIVTLGYGDPSGLFPRSPRLPFEDFCEIL